MSAKATKVYPVRGRWLSGVPAAVHVVASKGQADDLVASGAFTTNPNDPDRDDDAPELDGEPLEHAQTRFQGEAPETQPPEPPQPAATEAPHEAGSSDSESKE